MKMILRVFIWNADRYVKETPIVMLRKRRSLC